MRISIFKLPMLAVVCAFMLSSCSSHAYLSKVDGVGENVYGAEMSYVLYERKTKILKGELIAIDDSTLFVLLEKDDNLAVCEVPISEIKKLRIRFATSKDYLGKMAVVAGVSAIFHGYGAVIGIPLNLAVGVFLSESAKWQVQYTDRHLTFEEMKMFARFPHGIPEGLDLRDIQRVDDD